MNLRTPTSLLASALTPALAPLAMPVRGLDAPARARRLPRPPGLVARRLAVWTAAAAAVAALAWAMASGLARDGIAAVDVAIFGLYLPIVALNALAAATAVAGLAWAGRARRIAAPPAGWGPNMRTAVLIPARNEDVPALGRRIAALAHDLAAEGLGAHVDLFLLSDSDDPAVIAAEERLAVELACGASRPRVYYRRRLGNEGRKPGNLANWLKQWGGHYAHMLVLDADSVMSGAAIARLVRVMEGHPEIGILQQLIVGLPNLGPFPRIFQFGMRHGMRAHTVGSAWWQGDCGSYWGHNALIRIAPFMAHCRLPELPGGPPLGGRVLSHDQVEAVLMRRAGWEVRVLPDEDGSYEENPPTLSDFVKRDLRWCQGNWQYLHLLARPGLHAMGRLQLLLAILMYVSGPAWILFSLVGFGRAMLPAAVPPDPVVPLLGVPSAWEPWALLAATMTLVFTPKLAGVVQVLLLPRLRRAYGGGMRVAASALVELLFSFVLAPIIAVGQSMFLLGMLAGRTIRWDAQLRDPRALGWREAWRGLWPHTALGVALGVAVWIFGGEGARLWAVLFCGPLILSVPFAVVTSWSGLGRVLARLGICAVPEEVAPSRVVIAAGHATGSVPAPVTGGGGPVMAEVPAAPPVD